MTLYKHEMKMNLKSLMIWTLCVAGICFGCILLYTSLEDSIQEMAEAYSNMGAMSTALGMDKMSLATMTGYYATEIAMMHGLGGALFAGILGSGILSKEESGHTSEFLAVFPIKRGAIVVQKYLALLTDILIFHFVCSGIYLLGFEAMGEQIPVKEFLLYHLAAAFMNFEIATVCFMISAFTKRVLLGAGLGIAVLLFAADLMCRIIPAIEFLKYITPFYYANASDIFTDKTIPVSMLLIAALITILAFVIAFCRYTTKDLAP